MRTRMIWCAAVLVTAVGGCGSMTDQGPIDVSLVGNWHYMAAQTTGNRVTYDGTLAITQQQGRTFAGDSMRRRWCRRGTSCV